MTYQPLDSQEAMIEIDPPDLHFAGPDRRLGAYVIDVVLVAGILVGTQFLLSRITNGFPFNLLTTGLRIEIWVFLTVSLPTWLYFAYFESSDRQATLGKRLFKLRVTDTNQQPIGFWRAFIRTLIKLIPWELTHVVLFFPTPIMTDPNPSPRLGLFLVYPLLVLYMVSIIFTPRKRSIHDLLVGTLVLYDGALQAELPVGTSSESEPYEN
jgi:uncharacterized RDD family membrane protein YckC